MMYDCILYDTYKECVRMLGKKDLKQLKEIRNFMIKQKDEELLPFEPTEKEMLAYTE